MPAPALLGAPVPIGGIDYRWLFAGSEAGVTRWRCRMRGSGRSEERVQPAHVVVFLHAGAFRLHGAAGEALAEPARALFLPPASPYRTSHPAGCGDRGSAIALSEEMADELLGSAGTPRPDALLPARVSLRQHRLVRRLDEGTIDALEAEESAIAIAAAAASCTGLASPTPRGRPERRRAAADRLREILAAEFRRPLRLDALARLAGLSPFHACRAFREAWGLSIHRYRTGLRLRAALDALDGGQTDLTDLALSLGFSSHSHFTQAFRREFETTPSAVRGDPRRAGSR